MTTIAASMLALVLCCLAATSAMARPGPKKGAQGILLQGYTTTYDVSGPLALTGDLCDLVAAMPSTGPNFVLGKSIYNGGNYTSAIGGESLRDAANAQYGGYYFDVYSSYFNSSTWNADYVQSAMEGRRYLPQLNNDYARSQAARKGNQYGTIMAYVFGKLDAARSTGNYKKAAQYVDEAFAAYAGNAANCTRAPTPYYLSENRATSFNTRATCNVSRANQQLVAAFKSAKDATMPGNKGKMDQLNAAIASIQRSSIIGYIQATIFYATVVDKVQSERDEVWRGEAVEAYTFFRAVEPLIAQSSQYAVDEVKRVLLRDPSYVLPPPGEYVPNSVYNAVKSALETAYAGLGISRKDIGTYTPDAAPVLAC